VNESDESESDDSGENENVRTQTLYPCRHTSGNCIQFSHRGNRVRHERSHFAKLGICPEPCECCVQLNVTSCASQSLYEQQTKRVKCQNLLQKGKEMFKSSTSADVISFLLLSIPKDDAVTAIMMSLTQKPNLKRALDAILRLPDDLRERCVIQRQEEKKHKRETIVQMCTELRIGEEKYRGLERYYQIGFSVDQLRYWRQKDINKLGIYRCPSGYGYLSTLVDALSVMFQEEKGWEKLRREFLDCRLPFVIQIDWGSIDSRNGCVFVKVGRQDPLWMEGSRYKKPGLNTTLGVFYMIETYDNIFLTMRKIYLEMESVQLDFGNQGKWKTSWIEVHDMKMSLLVLGNDELWRSTCCRGCPKCGAKRRNVGDSLDVYLPEWSDFSKQRFYGARSISDWIKICELDEEEPDKFLHASDPKNHSGPVEGLKPTTLEQKKEDGKKVEDMRKRAEMKERGAVGKLGKLIKETGMLALPITTTPTHLHYGELIHIDENITKKAVKLCIEQLPATSEIESRILSAINYHAKMKIERKKPKKGKKKEVISTWGLIKRARLNKTQWIRVLKGFFVESDISTSASVTGHFVIYHL
jgi:hypothetical protein